MFGAGGLELGQEGGAVGVLFGLEGLRELQFDGQGFGVSHIYLLAMIAPTIR